MKRFKRIMSVLLVVAVFIPGIVIGVSDDGYMKERVKMPTDIKIEEFAIEEDEDLDKFLESLGEKESDKELGIKEVIF